MAKRPGDKHLSPKERRDLVARVNALFNDHNRGDAYKIAAKEAGVHPATAELWTTRFKREGIKVPLTYPVNVEPLASADFEVITPEPASQKTVLVPITERTLEMIVSDVHVPYHDQAAWQLFLDVAHDLQPQILVLLGDMMDMYGVSAHDKDPNRATPAAFKEELIVMRQFLQEIRETLPNTRIFYKEGNHETRLSRYILKNAPALSNLSVVTLPELLNLKDLSIEWIGNNERLRIGKLWHIHGNEIGGGGQNPARLKYLRMQTNFIFGHLHTRDKYRPMAYDGQQHGAWANPCLCRLDAEYLHHASSWSLGFSPVHHDSDGTFQVEETEVIKTSGHSAKCFVLGKSYEVSL